MYIECICMYIYTYTHTSLFLKSYARPATVKPVPVPPKRWGYFISNSYPGDSGDRKSFNFVTIPYINGMIYDELLIT